jgi:hypothetical protein
VQPSQAPFDRKRAIVGAVIGLAGHALAFAVGFVAAAVTPAGSGGGFSDLAAAVSAFFLVEIIVGLGCLIGGGLLFRSGRRELGVGLLGGWVVGLVLAWAYIFLSAS